MLPECVRLLVEAGQFAPSADNMQPWSFSWDGECLSLSYRGAGEDAQLFAEAEPATQMAMGAAVENVVQIAAIMGLSHAVAVGGGPSPAPYLTVRPGPSAVAPQNVRQHPIFLRHTDRLPYRRTPLTPEMPNELERLSEATASVTVVADDARRAEIAALVRTASQVRFRLRHVHEWFMATLRYSAADVTRGDGLDVQTLDLPPGGGMLLKALRNWRTMAAANRLGIYRMFAEIEARPIRLGPGVVVLHAAADPQAAFQAGRLMERVWLRLNEQGLAVQPCYVVTDTIERLQSDPAMPQSLKQDLAGFEQRVGQVLSLPPGRKLYMLLRVGLPRKSPVRARRLPINRICPQAD